MKRLVFIFLMIAFCLDAQHAFCQVKNDFSDWNVPPPVPIGTIPKSGGGVKPALLQLPVDVAAPKLQLIDLKLAALSPILQTAPDVPAPEQPKFPPLPFEVPDIPLPQVPLAMALPKQTPHDEIIESNTDMPEPAVPEMPDFPKMPDANQKTTDDGILKLPLVPDIIVEPGTSALPADAFPFLEWPVPAIPENSQVDNDQPDSMNNDNIKPTNKNKTAKKLKGG